MRLNLQYSYLPLSALPDVLHYLDVLHHSTAVVQASAGEALTPTYRAHTLVYTNVSSDKATMQFLLIPVHVVCGEIGGVSEDGRARRFEREDLASFAMG